MNPVEIREKALSLAAGSLPLASTNELVKRARAFENYLAGNMPVAASEPFTGDMPPSLMDAQHEPAAETDGDCA